MPSETIVGSPTVDEETHMLDPTLHTEDPIVAKVIDYTQLVKQAFAEVRNVHEELFCSSQNRVEVLANRISESEQGLAQSLELLEQESRSVQSVPQLQHPDRDIIYNLLQTSFLKEFEALRTRLQLSHLQEVQMCKAELQKVLQHSTESASFFYPVKQR